MLIKRRRLYDYEVAQEPDTNCGIRVKLEKLEWQSRIMRSGSGATTRALPAELTAIPIPVRVLAVLCFISVKSSQAGQRGQVIHIK